MFEAGFVIENCQIIEEIGAGGTGVIYKAYHLRLQKYVVLKRIKQSVVNKINIRGEVDILKRVKHSYLPQVYDFIITDDEVFTVIDYIEGQSLEYYVSAHYKFTQQQLINWAIQLCEALSYLHTQNPAIIHSDIKPANIMVAPQGNICLIDFNISLEDDEQAHLAGMTQEYASPEQYVVAQKVSGILNSDGSTNNPSAFTYQNNTQILLVNRIDARSDIYSLGATFYYLITGVKPKKAVDGNIPLNNLELPYSEAFLDIMTKAMEQNLDKRFQTAEEMLTTLKNITKLDKRYKSLKTKQTITTLLFTSLMVFFGVVSYFGYNIIISEKNYKYNELISFGNEQEKSENYISAINNFKEAQILISDKLAAYFEEIKLYSSIGDFDKVISSGKLLLHSTVLQKEFAEKTKELADINYLIANAYFENENYKIAIEFYNDTINLDKSNPLYFRDYAIALARTGENANAENKLKEAKQLGLEEPSVLLVSGELYLANEEYANAINDFKKALSLSKESGVKSRSYILCADAYKKSGNFDEQIAILEEARKVLPQEYQNPILNTLAGCYSLKSQQKAADYIQYVNKAVDIYLVLYNNGFPTESLLLNLSNGYQRLAQFDKAVKYLTEAKGKYAESYKVYLRLALLEADKQSQIADDKKNYTSVSEYYVMAKKYYKYASINGTSDSEMTQLETIIAKLKEGNWI